MIKKPALICLTPVRNEAWCLDVFLKCTSLWADHIIIADQNSTDGSREIARKYPKVKLLVNNSENYDEDERQKMLINEARKIDGAKILVALDADEIFSANYWETDDWQRILNSIPGDVFWFKWAQLETDHLNYWSPDTYFAWVFHDDGIEPHGNYSNKIHSMRIPYPIEENQMFYVDDFVVLHIPFLYPKRQESKARYYQCVEKILYNRDTVSLFRQYCSTQTKKLLHIEHKWIEGYKQYGVDIIKGLHLNKDHFWFDDEVIHFFEKHGIGRFKDMCIFDSKWLKKNKLKDPRSKKVKLLHRYLEITKNNYNNMFITITDKLLSMCYK